MLFNQLCLTYKLKIISRVSSITGRPNFDPLVAVEVIAIDPSPTSGLILRAILAGLIPSQDVLSRSSTISISSSLSRMMMMPDLSEYSSSDLNWFLACYADFIETETHRIILGKWHDIVQWTGYITISKFNNMISVIALVLLPNVFGNVGRVLQLVFEINKQMHCAFLQQTKIFTS